MSKLYLGAAIGLVVISTAANAQFGSANAYRDQNSVGPSGPCEKAETISALEKCLGRNPPVSRKHRPAPTPSH